MKKTMLNSTKGINTYKGLIFLSLFVAYCFFKDYKLDKYHSVVEKLSKNIYEDFKDKEISNGIKIYNEYGIKGIREIPYNGFEIIEKEFLQQFLLLKNIDKLTLNIMNEIDDTTTIHRCGIEKYKVFKKKVKDSINGNLWRFELDNYCIKNKISTGGTADILIITLVFYMIMVFEGGNSVHEINKQWGLWKFTI